MPVPGTLRKRSRLLRFVKRRKKKMLWQSWKQCEATVPSLTLW